MFTTSWELVCSRFLQLPAPNLEFVCIITESYTGFAPKLTHSLFEHHAPNLQSLQLHQCMVDFTKFTSPILTSLTELYIYGIFFGESAFPTVLDRLNIFSGMPSLRWVVLVRAISSATTIVTSSYPIIHLTALNMLSVEGSIEESVSLVEHLIAPRCGLRLRCDGVQLGSDLGRLWAIIEKKLDLWAENAPNRHLKAYSTRKAVTVGNLPDCQIRERDTEAIAAHYKHYTHLLDPVLTIKLYLSKPQQANDVVPLFLSLFALFKRTFFDTTYLKLWIEHDLDGSEVFLPLVDSFRAFVNLEKVHLLYLGNSLSMFPLLQHSLPNSVLLPALQSLCFSNAIFRQNYPYALHQVTGFLRWRREQGFPVQKINTIVDSQITTSRIHTNILSRHSRRVWRLLPRMG